MPVPKLSNVHDDDDSNIYHVNHVNDSSVNTIHVANDEFYNDHNHDEEDHKNSDPPNNTTCNDTACSSNDKSNTPYTQKERLSRSEYSSIFSNKGISLLSFNFQHCYSSR